MIQARWLIIFFAVLGMTIPSFAIDLSLGGFPSYMRTRARYLSNATFMNTLTPADGMVVGNDDNDDQIFFVDTTLRLTPQLGLSDAVTIRAQVDVMNNGIWGGRSSGFFGDTDTGMGDSVVLSDLRPNDRFRGAILAGSKAYDNNAGYFSVRMLHADIVLPNNLGFVRIGRQPFDWGLGILANGGHDPKSDLGFVVDRLLWLKSFPAGPGTFTLVLVSDVFSGGSGPFSGSGTGYDIAAAAAIYNQQVGAVNMTVGGYAFPYIHQNNIFSSANGSYGWDLDRTALYAGMLALKADSWSFNYEVQMFGGGTLDTPLGANGANFPIKLGYAFNMAGRLEYYPSMMAQVTTIGLEGGWAQGDDGSTANTVEGNALPFSPAYNVDNLLFKHMIPTIYNIEGSVINAYYGKVYANLKLADNLSFMPQVLTAWNHEKVAGSAFDSGAFGSGILPNTQVDSYLGTEVEGTLTWTIYPGVDLDFMGSVVFAGNGLKDLLMASGAERAGDARRATCVAGDTACMGQANPSVGNAEGTAWAVQTRLMVYIDQFIN